MIKLLVDHQVWSGYEQAKSIDRNRLERIERALNMLIEEHNAMIRGPLKSTLVTLPHDVEYEFKDPNEVPVEDHRNDL